MPDAMEHGPSKVLGRDPPSTPRRVDASLVHVSDAEDRRDLPGHATDSQMKVGIEHWVDCSPPFEGSRDSRCDQFQIEELLSRPPGF